MAKESTLEEVFVGRNDVLEQLKARFNDLNEGCSRVIFIAGESGIGKTAVVNHLLNTLSSLTKTRGNQSEPLIFILRASCESGWSGDPYAPFARLLERLPENAQKKLEEKLKYWARELGPAVVEGVIPFLGPVLAKALEMQLSKQSKQSGLLMPHGQSYKFLQFFEQLSKVCPLVLFIDDLHWADEASLRLISTLAQTETEGQIMLIGTYRPHEITPAHPFSNVLRTLRRNHLLDEISLQQLTSHDIEHFLNRCYPNNKFPSSLGMMLYKKTNGLPFFLYQLVRLLTDRGDIFLDADNKWSSRQLDDEVPIPKESLGVVEERLLNLDHDSYLLLRYASVLGEQFRSQVLAKIVKKDLLEVLGKLRELQTEYGLVREIVEASESRFQPNWIFQHAFVHQALYDSKSFNKSLGTDERILLHGRTLDALESLFPDSRDELASELAHHCENARRYDHAVKYRITAALRAYKAQSFTEQAAHLAQGISDVEQLERNKVDLRDEVILLSGLAHAYRQRMALDDEERVAKRLLQLFDQGNGYTVAGIEGCHGLVHRATQRSDKNSAIKYNEQAWSIARQSNATHHMVRVASFVTSGWYRFIPKRLREYMDDTIKFCRKDNSPVLLSKSLLCKGAFAILEGDDDLALPLFHEAIETVKDIKENDIRLAEDYPFIIGSYSPCRFIPDCFEYMGDIHRRRSEWDRAIEKYKEVYKFKEAEKNLAGMSGLLNVIAVTQLMAGLKEDADLSFKKSWPMAKQHDSLELQIMVLSTGIAIALEQEDNVTAKERLTLFEDVPHDSDAEWIWHVKQMSHGILNMQAKATKEATSFLTDGLKKAEEKDNFGKITQYNRHLAELSLQSNDLGQALHYANNALQISREHVLWEQGEVHMTAARVKWRMSKIDEAEELIQQALEYFQNKKLPHKVVLAQEFQRQIRNAR